jgi:hypothetical protein
MPINRAQTAQSKPDTPAAAQSLTQSNTMEPTSAGMLGLAVRPLRLARARRGCGADSANPREESRAFSELSPTDLGPGLSFPR